MKVPILRLYMGFNPAETAGNRGDSRDLGLGAGTTQSQTVKVLGARSLFKKKNPGSPGKLGRTSTKAESLSKLRGKGALA